MTLSFEQTRFLMALSLIDSQLMEWAKKRMAEGRTLDEIKTRIRRAMIASGRI